MRRVNILTIHQEAANAFRRQSPQVREDGAVLWKDLAFFFNVEVQPTDLVVAWDFPPNNIPVAVGSRKQLIHIATESWPDRYPIDFLKQFGVVVSQHPRHADYDGIWVLNHGCLEWWYGVRGRAPRQVAMDWRGLLYSPTKTNQRISVITSTLNNLPGHILRNSFIEKLQASNLPIDFFGFGRREIGDKVEGLAHYPYHIAMENTFMDYYWTEKLADPLLAECFVFYAGCTNVQLFFDKKSIMTIDINDPAGSIKKIQRALAERVYEKNLAIIKQNKKQLMEEQNIYHFIWRLVRDCQL